MEPTSLILIIFGLCFSSIGMYFVVDNLRVKNYYEASFLVIFPLIGSLPIIFGCINLFGGEAPGNLLNLLLPIAFFIYGLCMSIRTTIWYNRVYKSWLSVPAKCIDILILESKINSNGSRKITRIPLFEYNYNGTIYTSTPEINTGICFNKVGSTSNIKINPTNPDDLHILNVASILKEIIFPAMILTASMVLLYNGLFN